MHRPEDSFRQGPSSCEWSGEERRSRPDNRALIKEIIDAARGTDEARWVQLAIQREAQSIKLRQAVIEKTLAGLAWLALAGLGVGLWDGFIAFMQRHGVNLIR